MVFPCAADAQEMDQISLPGYQIRISYWRSSHGLPSWHIWNILNDSRGLVWMATDIGLVSLDGKRFRQHPVSVPDALKDRLRHIALDGRDNLWLFYRQQDKTAVYVYDPRQERTLTAEAYTGRQLAFSENILQTLFARKDRLWLLDGKTGRGGYYSATAGWVDALRDTGYLNQNMYYLPGPEGRFWKIDLQRLQVEQINATGAASCVCSFAETKDPVNFMTDDRGSIYLLFNRPDAQGAPVSLMRCDPEAGLLPADAMTQRRGGYFKFAVQLPFREQNSAGVELIKQGSDLDVYIHGKQLFRGFKTYLKEMHHLYLERMLFVLEDGSFWMFGADALIRMEVLPSHFTNYLNQQRLPIRTRGLAVSKGILYANCHLGQYAVDLRSGRQRQLLSFNPYSYGFALSLHKGMLWFGSQSNSATVYDPASGKSHNYPLESPPLKTSEWHFAPGGGIYLGTEQGLFKFMPSAGVFRLWEMGDRSVSCFHRNAAGLWAGTTKGLALLDGQERLQRNFFADVFGAGKPLLIKHIYEDAEGVFWLATEQGLWRWRPFSNESQVYDVARTGFPSDRLHAVYEDRRRRLWISSDGGLICFDKQRERFRTYTASDGLSGTEKNWLSHHRDSTGRLYIGGVFGVTAFHPDSIPDEPYGPPHLELLKVKFFSKKDNQATNLTDEALTGNQLRIPAKSDHLFVEFSALEFQLRPLAYRWRIPELDSAWSVIEEPRIDLYQPPYGRYTIEIEARYVGNNLSPPGMHRLLLYGQKPFYLRPWFFGSAVLAVMAIMTVFFQWRQRQLRVNSQNLAFEVAEKTEQLRQERDMIARQAAALEQLNVEKSRFFQDLGHEIRNPLTLILGPVSDMLRRAELTPKQTERLERVKGNTSKILDLVDEILELSMLETAVISPKNHPFNAEALVSRICQEFEPAAVQKGIAFRPGLVFLPSLVLLGDTRKLKKILTNLLQNALKFTPAGGAIEVRAEYTAEDGFLLFEVRDTGPGIAPEYLERIFERYFQVPGQTGKGFGIGLSMCRSYAMLMGGSVQAMSSPGQGATFRVRIPFATAPG